MSKTFLSRSAAYLAFFLSGASSLIFQTIWSRMLGRVFGASHVAISTTVTLFMAGLGLGAFVAGRYADRIKRPVLAYGVVEGIVGLWALLVPWMVNTEGWLADVNVWLRNDIDSQWLRLALRFAVVAPILLVPTTLMGSSLPLLSRHFVSRAQDKDSVSSWVGSLYAVNTLGAVAGVALGGFLLLPNLGVRTTNWIAASMNLALFGAIFLLRSAFAPVEPAAAPTTADAVKPRSRLRWVAFVAFAASGLGSLCYEVVWSRALAMTIGSSFVTFQLILLTFLIGIAGGSAAMSNVLAETRQWRTLAVFTVLLAVLGTSSKAVGDGGSLLSWLLFAFHAAAPGLAIAYFWRRRKPVESSEVAEFASDPSRLWNYLPALAILIPVAVSIALALMHGERDESAPADLSEIVAAASTIIAVFTAIIFTLKRTPMLLLATMMLFIGIAAFTSFYYQDEIPCAFASMVSGIQGELYKHVELVRGLMWFTAALSILPATLAMGAMFPIVLRVWTQGGSDIGKDVGTVYSGNTLGSILGAWLPGFVLMEWLGLERTILTGMMLYLVVGLVVLLIAASARNEGEPETPPEEESAGTSRLQLFTYAVAPLIPPFLVFLFVLGWPGEKFADFAARYRWNPSQMTLGVFRVSVARQACTPDFGEADLVYYHDGLSTTVTVERWGRHYALKNNGKVDASNGDDMPTQVMVSSYPLLMHSAGAEGLDVAVVGYGSGVSVGTALQFPVRSVDVIELERSILDASRVFAEQSHLDYNLPNFPYVQMDRLSIINDDGRNYLASTDRRYDVIVSEPSNPWITGVSDLFTTDHWRITKSRLRPGGIYCQWVQLYEMSPDNIKVIYRTFASQFEHVVVFAAEDMSSDTVLLGSDSPIPLDITRVAHAMENESVRTELERAYIHSPYDVFARTLFASKAEVLRFAQLEERRDGADWNPVLEANGNDVCEEPNCRRRPATINTDDNVHIEFAAPRDLIGYQRFEGYLSSIYTDSWPYGRLPGNLVGLADGQEGEDQRAGVAMALLAHGRKQEAADFIVPPESPAMGQEMRFAAEVYTRLATSAGEPTIFIEEPSPSLELAPPLLRQLTEGFAAAKAAIEARNFNAALRALDSIDAPVRRHSGPSLLLLHAYVFYRTARDHPSRYADVTDLLEDIIRRDLDYSTRHPEIYYFLARAHDAQMHFDKGVRNMRLFVELRDAARQEASQRESAQ